MRRSTETRLLAACGPLAALFFLAADLVGSNLTPGYSMQTQAISELMEKNAPAKWIVDPLLIVYHALVIPFAIGVHRGVMEVGKNLLAPALLAFAGAAGVILTLFFPCDPGCEPFVSLSGTLHIFIAIPMGFAILFAVLAFSFRFESRVLQGYSRITFALGIAMAIVTVMLAESGWVGLVERLLTWTYLQWYVVIGVIIVSSYRPQES